eukprot:Clim_evm49s191 gene=Clim_evmTU49s191
MAEYAEYAESRSSSPATTDPVEKTVKDVNTEISTLLKDLCTSEVAPSFLCKLCNDLIVAPVITDCGHTFCRQCVASAGEEGVCPQHESGFSRVLPNLALKDQLDQLQLHCPNHELGCETELLMKDLDSHKTECEYTPTQCPQCGSKRVPRRSFTDHLMKCFMQGMEPRELSENGGLCEKEDVDDRQNSSQSNAQVLGVIFSKMAQMTEMQQKQYEMLTVSIGSLSNRISDLEFKLKPTVIEVDRKVSELSTDTANFKEELSALRQDLAKLEVEAAKSIVTPGMGNSAPGGAGGQNKYICKGTIETHQGPIWSLASFGRYLFTGSSTGSVKIWDINTQKCLKELNEHSATVNAIATTATHFYTGSLDTTIIMWNMSTFEMEKKVMHEDLPISSLLANRGYHLAGSLHTVIVYEANTMQQKKMITDLRHWVRVMVATEDYLFLGSYRSITVFNLRDFEYVRIVNIVGGSVYSMVIMDGYLVCGMYEKVIQVLNLQGLVPVTSLEGHRGTVYALATGGNHLISGSYDGTIKVWDLHRMQCLQTLARHGGSVDTLAWINDGFYSGSADGEVRLFL